MKLTFMTEFGSQLNSCEATRLCWLIMYIGNHAWQDRKCTTTCTCGHRAYPARRAWSCPVGLWLVVSWCGDVPYMGILEIKVLGSHPSSIIACSSFPFALSCVFFILSHSSASIWCTASLLYGCCGCCRIALSAAHLVELYCRLCCHGRRGMCWTVG